MTTKEIKNIHEAIFIIQNSAGKVFKSKFNNYLKTKFFTYENVIDILNPLFLKHDVGYSFLYEGVKLKLVVFLKNDAKQRIESFIAIAESQRENATAFISDSTFYKKTLLINIFGLGAGEEQQIKESSKIMAESLDKEVKRLQYVINKGIDISPDTFLNIFNDISQGDINKDFKSDFLNNKYRELLDKENGNIEAEKE